MSNSGPVESVSDKEMLLAFEVLTVFLTAVTMGLALAHALEFPGKLRLDEQTYRAVQAIYYPGFTIGGAAEPIAAIAVLILLLIMHDRTAQFWWLFVAFVSLGAMHAVFWLVTQRVNRFWMKNQNLSKAGAKFFNAESIKAEDRVAAGPDWRYLRDRWEYSHVIRAVLSIIGFIAIIVVVATRAPVE